MPIFSYICEDCTAKFDLLERSSNKGEKKVCKKCGSKNIKKTFAAFGVSISAGKSSNSSCPTGTCPF